MTLAFAILVVVSLYFFVIGLLRKDRSLRLPTAVGFLYLAFFIPQAIYLERSGLSETYGGWLLYSYMSACLIAVAAGFNVLFRRTSRRAGTQIPSSVPESRLMVGAVALMALGSFANWRLSGIDTDTLGNQWTGIATFWYLLAQGSFVALALAMIRFLATRRLVYLVIICITLFAVLTGFGGNVKRHMIAEVIIILGGAWVFVRRWQPPRLMILAVCFVGMVLLHQVGAVRKYVEEGRGNAYQAILQGVPFERFAYFSLDDAPELSIALLDFHYSQKSGTVEGPVDLWNTLVHQYVPAFIVGAEAKKNLKVNEPASTSRGYDYFKYATVGITHTGFSDSFRSYSFFGVLVFVGLGAFFGWLYGYAIHGSVWAQLYYIILLNDALVAFTQSTSRFIAVLPFLLILTLPVVIPNLRNPKKRRLIRRRDISITNSVSTAFSRGSIKRSAKYSPNNRSGT